MTVPGPSLPAFRERGHQVTRLESFVDAAFAFSLTMLVILFNELPDTVAELREVLRRVPTFVFCFVLIALFWGAHNRWSRRFGLDDGRSIVLSLALVLVVMIYVYPLRMVVSSAMAMFTGAWVKSELGIDPVHWNADLQTAFMVYAVGFGLLSWIVCELNRHALRRADALGLSVAERYETGTEIGLHWILTGTAVLSLLLSGLALAWPGENAPGLIAALPVWVYAGLGAAMPLYAKRRNRSWLLRQSPQEASA